MFQVLWGPDQKALHQSRGHKLCFFSLFIPVKFHQHHKKMIRHDYMATAKLIPLPLEWIDWLSEVVLGSQFVFFFYIFVLSLWVTIVIAPIKLVCCSIVSNAGVVLGCFSTDRAKAKLSIYQSIYIQTVTYGHGEKKKRRSCDYKLVEIPPSAGWARLSSALQMELWRELEVESLLLSLQGEGQYLISLDENVLYKSFRQV